MKVRIVLYEDFDHWILEKFALKLQQELTALSVVADIANTPDKYADINHHIIYYPYNSQKNSVDTLMITHIDSVSKTKRIRHQLQVANMGICMSRQTVDQLAATGIPRDRLCFVNPAHDNVIRPRRTVIGLTSRLYSDGRKQEQYLVDVAEKISPEDFSFKIMGNGWQPIVDCLRRSGFDVEYYAEFSYEAYVTLVPTFDYYLYFSFDEGSMGLIDALAAGVKTIVTPQGFHLDLPGGIVHPIHSVRDTVEALQKIVLEKQVLPSLVLQWTWRDYALKHLAIWEYLLSNRSSAYLMKHRHRYDDGLASVCAPGGAVPVSFIEKSRVRMRIVQSSMKFLWRDIKNNLSRNFGRSR